DGEKRYHPDGTTQGSFWMLGEPEGVVFLAEGFATAATIYEVTGNACLVAFSAHALPQVAKIWRERFLDSDLRIVADNDASGTGLMYASQAAAKHNATLIEIPIEGDANDYHLAGGDLLGLLNPPEEEAWLVAADDFAADPRPIPWLVKDWVQDEALIMVHGPSGGGKTFLVLDWALHIASIPHGECGEWGDSTVESGGVVYLAGEGHFGLRARISAWKQQHQPQSRLRMWLSRSGCDLNKDSGFRQAAQQIRKLPEKPRLIVVDTLHRFLDGDENSSQDAKTMLDACSKLMQEFSCSVLLVHHTGVNDENQHRARGSSAWRAALDIEISVVPPKRKNTPLQVVQRKSKDSELAPPIHGEIVPITLVGTCGDSGEPVKSAIFQLVDSDEVLQNLDPKVSDFRSKFEGAWRQSGKEMVDGAPYVTRSALKAYLVDGGMSSRSATNTLDGYNYPKMMIGTLTAASLVTACNQGWKVIDQKTIEMMLL
ncbi:MAG: AAA family ATPase, partial [bacterium]